MHIVGATIAVLSAALAALAMIDGLLFLLRVHGPFTATGELLQFCSLLALENPAFWGE
jgi:hypothetical protein